MLGQALHPPYHKQPSIVRRSVEPIEFRMRVRVWQLEFADEAAPIRCGTLIICQSCKGFEPPLELINLRRWNVAPGGDAGTRDFVTAGVEEKEGDNTCRPFGSGNISGL